MTDKQSTKELLKEKLLQGKQDTKELTEAARIIRKLDLDKLDKEAFLGACLDIAQKSGHHESIQEWRKKARTFLKNEDSEEKVSLSIVFHVPPNEEIKEKLLNLGFKWNNFRKTFRGCGNKINIQELLHDVDCTVETIA